MKDRAKTGVALFGVTVQLILSLISVYCLIFLAQLTFSVWPIIENYTVVLMSPELESFYIDFPFRVLYLILSVFVMLRLMRYAPFSLKLGLSFILNKLKVNDHE